MNFHETVNESINNEQFERDIDLYDNESMISFDDTLMHDTLVSCLKPEKHE